MLRFHVQHEVAGDNAGLIVVSRIDWEGQVKTIGSAPPDFRFEFIHTATGHSYVARVPESSMSDYCTGQNATDLFNGPEVRWLDRDMALIIFTPVGQTCLGVNLKCLSQDDRLGG